MSLQLLCAFYATELAIGAAIAWNDPRALRVLRECWWPSHERARESEWVLLDTNPRVVEDGARASRRA